MSCFWDVGVLVEVIGPNGLQYQVRGRLPKESVMGESTGQKLAAQELVIHLNSCKVNNIRVKSTRPIISSISKLKRC